MHARHRAPGPFCQEPSCHGDQQTSPSCFWTGYTDGWSHHTALGDGPGDTDLSRWDLPERVESEGELTPLTRDKILGGVNWQE